jgi:nucleotide-binding universal stress UspA family protein
MKNEADWPGRPGVVVGVDGSESSYAAFVHGAWEARVRGLPLTLVHCQDIPSGLVALSLAADLNSAAEAAAQQLADLSEQARVAFPGLEVDTFTATGPAAATLVRVSQDADLMVVGSRGLGGFRGLLLGSVSAQLSAHSVAPLIVIRPDAGGAARELGSPPPSRPVVVGVDGAAEGEAAIAFAFAQAAARGVPVVVLYAWWMLPVTKMPADPDLAAAHERARQFLVEATAQTREAYPGLDVELRPARALNPVLALLDASADAGLLVVSRHGGNALSRLLFSSVGDTAVREAACPVAVVPETSTRDSARREPAAATTR